MFSLVNRGIPSWSRNTKVIDSTVAVMVEKPPIVPRDLVCLEIYHSIVSVGGSVILSLV